MKGETLAIDAMMEASKGLLKAKNDYIVKKIKEVDWDTYEYLDLVFVENYVPVDGPEGQLHYNTGLKAIDVPHGDDPPDYDWYDSLYDTNPEVLRITEEFGEKVLQEWD